MLEKLKKIREENNYSGSDVAEMVGITKGYYSLIENGKRGLSYPLAVKIAAVFNLKPDDIFLNNEFTK
ncbi:helix-turn-helix transcriptional regulator [Enterococcus sp. UD-01]|uniref:helix-turn-helix transcriptional regulator n=1 Tax=Enterococcus sp. UD-01 TaxID=3373911 RepID=UPI0038346E73